MFASIVGKYLVSKELISPAQFADIKQEMSKVRVKLGLIAVAEGLMTESEAERVNNLQAVMDKRFGDIAVEEGYLTTEQVEGLLKKQQNSYLAFAQCLENQQLLTVSQLEMIMKDFQEDNSFSITDVEDLKSDDVDRIVPLYLPVEARDYEALACVAIRTMVRLIDNDAYPKKAYFADEVKINNATMQSMDGNAPMYTVFGGQGQALLPLACTFAKEEFAQVDEDALDAVGELMNCINGLYASALSFQKINLELCPPEYFADAQYVKGSNMLVLPIVVKGQEISFILSKSKELTIS